jgi:hydrogenase nickel incorporation protein HypB
MCGICGCDDHHEHVHQHAHEHEHEARQIAYIEQSVLSENDRYAERNRRSFTAQQIFTLNLVSSPGAGKTTLLTNTLAYFKNKLSMAAIVGDQYTDRDAKRLQRTGVPAVQINTGKMCHLDAHHIHHAIQDLSLNPQSVLWIENIGNLVCPALFDLGETMRVVLLSVTEGDDKPLKYPYMFQGAALLVINKLDLLPYVDFDVAACIDYARRINPHIQVIQTTATKEQGLHPWYQWLTHAHQQRLANVGVSI